MSFDIETGELRETAHVTSLAGETDLTGLERVLRISRTPDKGLPQAGSSIRRSA